ncbi:MAG TPA: YunC family protein [Methanoregula sp.]|nr:YunC family protein [Methanoregula sp.]
MNVVNVQLSRKVAEGFVIPLGHVNLVGVKTDVGMVGCGAFDVAALDSFSYPAAKVRPSIGPSIVDIDDLLKGIVREANRSAVGRGIKTGMTGKQALELL